MACLRILRTPDYQVPYGSLSGQGFVYAREEYAMKLHLLLFGNVTVLTLAVYGGYAIGERLTGETVGHVATVRYEVAMPVVTRHLGKVHIVLDDGTLFVIPADGCVSIVRADETEGTCLGE